MALHRRQNVEDMRSAYDRSHTRSRSSAASDSARSRESGSLQSYATQPTRYSDCSAKRPPKAHCNPRDNGSDEAALRLFFDRQPQESPRASVETYASTVDGDDDGDGEAADETLDYYVPNLKPARSRQSALPASPADFSQLFPSGRRLHIHHDSSTEDGNLNLRVDAEVYAGDRRSEMTLYHLRLHSLLAREFSLRRYCRDSGREVCHSAWKQQNAVTAMRPGLQRSLSNALHSMRPKSDSKAPTLDSLRRSDSGYGSLTSDTAETAERPRSASHGAEARPPLSSDTIKLEFSNYAQMDVRRTGPKGHKRYDFEYWGVSYAWRRIVRKDGAEKSVAFHLTRSGSEKVLAYIVPVNREAGGCTDGLVRPCSFRLADEKLIDGPKDGADAVVASGLIALVDDSIRTRFSGKGTGSLLHPRANMNIEYVGPKRLITELFRRNSCESSRAGSRAPSSRRANTVALTSATTRMQPDTSRQSSYDR